VPDVDENERLEEFVEGFSLDPGVNVIKQSFLVIGGRKKLECLSIAIFFSQKLILQSFIEEIYILERFITKPFFHLCSKRV
jgi:hypothetical protein